MGHRSGDLSLLVPHISTHLNPRGPRSRYPALDQDRQRTDCKDAWNEGLLTFGPFLALEKVSYMVSGEPRKAQDGRG